MSKRKRTGSSQVAVAYIRASKDTQKLTPAVQRGDIERWALLHGIQIVSWHTDFDVSSVLPIEGRPALKEALKAVVEHRAGILIVSKRDRIARRPALTETIEIAVSAHGARVLSADGMSSATGVEGVILRGMSDLYAQVEREMIRTRTKAALAVKKSRGERVGAIPYGKRLAEDGIHLVPDEREIEVIVRAKQLSVTLSLGKIAQKLAEEGFYSRKAAVFDPKQVQRMLLGS